MCCLTTRYHLLPCCLLCSALSAVCFVQFFSVFLPLTLSLWLLVQGEGSRWAIKVYISKLYLSKWEAKTSDMSSSSHCFFHVVQRTRGRIFWSLWSFFWVQLQKGGKKRKAKSGVDFRGGTSEDVQTPPQHYDWVQDIIWSLNWTGRRAEVRIHPEAVKTMFKYHKKEPQWETKGVTANIWKYICEVIYWNIHSVFKVQCSTIKLKCKNRVCIIVTILKIII